MPIAAFLAFLALNGLLFTASRRLAARFSAEAVDQLAVTMLLAFFWLTSASLIAASAGHYDLPGMVLLLAPWLAAAWIWGAAPAIGLIPMAAEAWRWLAPRRALWLTLLPHAWFAVENMRALAAPPRAWDALVYHLTRAAFWIQDRGFSSRFWPEELKFYDYFSPAGDFLWAWTMQAGVGDALLFPAYVFIWIWMTANSFLLARELGLNAERAAWAVGAMMSTPALLGAANSAYVDNLTAALTVLGLTALLRSRRGDVLAWLLLAITSMTLAACTKFTGVPLLLVTVLATAVCLRQQRLLPGPGYCLLALVASLPFVLVTARTYARTGSLTYPFQLLDGTVSWLRGSPILAVIQRFGIEHRSATDFAELLPKLMLMPLNLGIWLSLLLPMALFGLWRLRKGLPTLHFMVLLAFATVPLAGALVPGNQAMIAFWALILGRHLLTTMAVIVMAAAALPQGLTAVVLGLAIVQNCVMRIRASGLVAAEFDMIVVCAGPLLLAMIAVLIWHGLAPRPQIKRMSQAAAVVGLLAVYWLSTLPAREHQRHAFYALVADPASHEMHNASYQDYVESWRMLDGEQCRRIGFSTAEVGLWFVYPYFGTRLQNRVELAGVAALSADGRLDRGGTAESRARFAALASRPDIDVIVLGGALPTESTVLLDLGYESARPAPGSELKIYRRH